MNGDKSRETAYEERQEYFQTFTGLMLEQKQGKFRVVIGDMNTRLHARLPSEASTLDPEEAPIFCNNYNK